MPTTACSAFLQPHVRRLTVGPSAAARLLPGTSLGLWRVEGERRRRDASATYRVICTPSGEQAALTVFDTPALQLGSYTRRLLGVAHILSAVEHPGVTDVIDVGLTADGRPYVVTDLDEGMTLVERIGAATISFEDALVILRAICAPLIAAHDVGVVHGSLTADRVVLVEGDDRCIKLLDWGFERAVLDEARRAGVERTAADPCTAPEASLGIVSPQLDVYAVGVIAYELVLGRPPFVADSTEDLRQQQEEGAPDPREAWPQIPLALESLLRAMLATDPRQRPTIHAVAERLGALEQELAPPPPPPAPAYMVPPDTYPQSRSYAPLWTIAATALAVAIGIAAPSLVEPEGDKVRTVASLSTPAPSPARMPPQLAPTTPVAEVAIASAPAVAPAAVPAAAPATPAAAEPSIEIVSIVSVPRKAARSVASRVVESPAPRRSVAVAKAPVARREAAPRRERSDISDRMDEIKAELLTRYQRIGRDLMQLRRERNNAATAEMWNQFKGLAIHHSLATAKTRASASATLDELRAKIERNKGVAVTDACKASPLADGCR